MFLEKQFQLEGNAKRIKLVKGNIKITFHIKIKTPRGALYCVKFDRKLCANGMQNISAHVIGKGATMSYDKADGLFGHAIKDMSMKIAN